MSDAVSSKYVKTFPSIANPFAKIGEILGPIVARILLGIADRRNAHAERIAASYRQDRWSDMVERDIADRSR